MTKQEQIYEIAKYVCNACEFGTYGTCSKQQTDIKNCSLALETAKNIYNAGYRKVPDGAVVPALEERDDEMKATNEILAERDDLIAKVGILGRENYDLKAENEQLKAKLEARLTCDFVKTAQIHAVQEFAEKVKTKSEMFLVAKGDGVYGEKPYVLIEKIDELLKELAECQR